EFQPVSEGIFQMRHQSQSYLVTFSPQLYEENPFLYFLTFGNPLFKNLLDQVVRYITSRVDLG
ncbi:MAG: hypothetical protein ACRC8Y_19860, partial [Chroococcales cyanobacterium]